MMMLKYTMEILHIAAIVQKSARDLELTPVIQPRPEGQQEVVIFDALITEKSLRETTRQLFLDGHYALAVEEGYKYINNAVKQRSGLNDDGASLMKTTFSTKNPRLKLNTLHTESQRNQQLGYMEILAGCMTGIRNPRAHEHRYLDEPEVALELLALANHLVRMINGSKRARRSSAVRSTP